LSRGRENRAGCGGKCGKSGKNARAAARGFRFGCGSL
jgi:hypothetical protein